MIGRTLSHYRITAKLGAGGMGIVYAAEDARLGRQVALKFVSSDLAHDEQALQRLRSEAKAASALNHPNICTIHDIGEEDGHPFIVMELMKGQTLRERLNQGPLKVLQLVDVGIEVADALHAAHSEGIIHRDIKPGNIFITERGHVKILDFGLAKLTQTLTTATTAEPAPATSATGVTHGTPAYMSPEQATGEPLDGRTDLFSLGVVLYESATGHHPFPGKTPAVVLAGILDRTPASPLAHNPDLPARLPEIISNCLEKDRELRYQSAADLRADLKRLRRDLDSAAVRSVDRTASVSLSGGQDPLTPRTNRSGGLRNESARSGPVETRRTPIGWWAGGALGLAGVLIAAFLALQRDAPPPAEDARASAPPAVPDTVAAPVTPPLQTSTPSTNVAPPAPTAPVAPEISIERPLALATASLNAGNYRAALAGAREVLALRPGHAGAAKIRDQATAMLARFDNEVGDARRRLAGGDLEGAARALERARGLDPTSPVLPELTARLGEAFRSRESATRPAPATPPQPAEPAPATPPVTVPQVVTLPPAAPQVPANTPPSQAAPPPTQTARPTEPAARPDPPPPGKEPSADNDDAAIRQVIANYGRAIENKDIRLFRAIKPNLTSEEERRLEAGFRAVNAQRVSLSIVSIERKGDRATVILRRRDEIEAGGRKQETETRQAITMSRTPSGWVISDIR